MKKRLKKYQKGGQISPNNQQSILGYKDVSPYKNASSLLINSPTGEITMDGVSKDLLGIDEYGNKQYMKANSGKYKFKGRKITEIPVHQSGAKIESSFEQRYKDGKVTADEVLKYNFENKQDYKQYFYNKEQEENRKKELGLINKDDYFLNTKGEIYEKELPEIVVKPKKYDLLEDYGSFIKSDYLKTNKETNKETQIDKAKNKNYSKEDANPLGTWLNSMYSGVKRYVGKQMESKQKPKTLNIPVKNNGYVKTREEKDESGKLHGFLNEFDNDKGFDYIVTPKLKELPKDTLYSKSKGVAHFLMDSDITDNQEYTSPYIDFSGNKIESKYKDKFIHHSTNTNPEDYVPYYKKLNNENYYNIKYGKVKDKNKFQGYESKMGLRQHRFSDIDFEGKGKKWEYATNVKYVPTKDGQQTSIVGEKKDNYSRFSGGSGVFIFKDKTGKEKIIDVAGSVNDIKKIGESLINREKLNSDDLIFGYYDMGSYSAKPYGGEKGVNTSQYRNYNHYNKGYSGGALHIPIKAEGGGLQNPAGGGFMDKAMPYMGAVTGGLDLAMNWDKKDNAQKGQGIGSTAGNIAGNILLPGVGGQIGSTIGGLIGQGIGSSMAVDKEPEKPIYQNMAGIAVGKQGMKINNINNNKTMDLRNAYDKYMTGGQMPKKSYQEGGLVSGEGAMPHSEGGVPTVDESGQQIAEVEGGERIFSIEDTQQMEQMAMQYMETQDESILADLGMFVVEAIGKQEQVNPSEEVPMEQQPMEDPMAGGMPPAMKMGGNIFQRP